MADSRPRSRIVPIMASPKPTGSPPAGNGPVQRAIVVAGRDLHLECLEERRLYAVPTVGDGNCLFYSLSDQIFGHMGGQDEIRARLVEHIRTNADYFIQFVPDVGGERRAPRRAAASLAKSLGREATLEGQWARFEALLSNMKENGFWGGSVEIQAFCQAYRRDVYVYTEQGITPFTSTIDRAIGRGQPVHIAYHSFRHYSSVRSLDGPHAGLPVLSRPSGYEFWGHDTSSEGKTEYGDGASSTDGSAFAGGEELWPKSISEAFPGCDRATGKVGLATYRPGLEVVDIDKGASSEEYDDAAFRDTITAYTAGFDEAVASTRDPNTGTSSVTLKGSAGDTLPVQAPALSCGSASAPIPIPGSAFNFAPVLYPTPSSPRRRLLKGSRPPPRTWLGSSSRSSSRNSTASKRSAGQSEDDDDSDCIRPPIRQRGRDRKRRILQDVTFGLSDRDDENSSIISIRRRADSGAVVERAEPGEDEGDAGVTDGRRVVQADEPPSVQTPDGEDGETPSSSSDESEATAAENDSDFEADE